MYEYIAINKAEMKFRDFDIYHAYYCGLCKDLKERYGRSGQITDVMIDSVGCLTGCLLIYLILCIVKKHASFQTH